jgi:hypothetical protein
MSAFLERRLAELNQEIRTYPGPIARCDQHLPALLEERTRIITELAHESCPPEARWGHDGGPTNDEERA